MNRRYTQFAQLKVGGDKARPTQRKGVEPTKSIKVPVIKIHMQKSGKVL
jgi:hypothetical protein